MIIGRQTRTTLLSCWVHKSLCVDVVHEVLHSYIYTCMHCSIPFVAVSVAGPAFKTNGAPSCLCSGAKAVRAVAPRRYGLWRHRENSLHAIKPQCRQKSTT